MAKIQRYLIADLVEGARENLSLIMQNSENITTKEKLQIREILTKIRELQITIKR